MLRAYILIEMLAGHSRDLVNTLKERQVAVEVDRVTGPYDVVAIIEATDLNKISEIVSTEIHSLTGVVRTNTCVSME